MVLQEEGIRGGKASALLYVQRATAWLGIIIGILHHVSSLTTPGGPPISCGHFKGWWLFSAAGMMDSQQWQEPGVLFEGSLCAAVRFMSSTEGAWGEVLWHLLQWVPDHRGHAQHHMGLPVITHSSLFPRPGITPSQILPFLCPWTHQSLGQYGDSSNADCLHPIKAPGGWGRSIVYWARCQRTRTRSTLSLDPINPSLIGGPQQSIICSESSVWPQTVLFLLLSVHLLE